MGNLSIVESLRITPEQAYVVMNSLDLTKVVDRTVRYGEVNEISAQDAADEYRKYMALCASYACKEHKMAISNAIDPIWHSHILHTKEYRRMCDALNVGFMHHEPADVKNLHILETEYSNTLTVYKKHFGIPKQEFWPEKAQICQGCACSDPGND